MGKKVKSKGRNPRRATHRPAAAPPHPVSEKPAALAGDGGEKDGETCNHYTPDSAELNRILSRIRSSPDGVLRSCEHCREEPVNKRGGREKGRQAKKRGGARAAAEPSTDAGFIWVCLDCGRGFCGGATSMSEPYGHARRHAKQERHPWAGRSDDPLTCWCFPCNSMVPLELPNGALKERAEEGGDDSTENRGEQMAVDGMRGYTMRGLVNLSNTCFLNSVMQNLFSMDMLRVYFMRLDRPVGPITMAVKKLFVETSAAADSRSVLSPKALLGCICAKAPQFRGYQQQDSHEYLRCLLDGLYTEEINARKFDASSDEKDKDSSNNGATFVEIIFGGQLSSTVCCVECGHTSVVREPFLDLSLPILTKKAPPQKVVAPPSKKTKPFAREGNRARKFREKTSARGSTVTENQKEDGLAKHSECSKSDVPSLEQEQNVTSNVEDSVCWLDYLDPSITSDFLDSASEKCEVPVEQPSDSGQISQSENNVEGVSESHFDTSSKELMVSSNSCGETSCSSCIQDKDVILLPYKELESTADDINKMKLCSENSENPSSVDAPVQESSIQASSVARPEQAEEEFDGFGDLFNELETTSDLKVETGTIEEMDMSLWAGNSSEFNQEEIDDSSAPVSVNSCLALFTKPELLLDEQGWYCEHCSEILSSQDEGCREGSQQTVARLNQSETLKTQVDGNEDKVNKAPYKPNVHSDGIAEHKVVCNGTMKSTPPNSALNVQMFDDPCAKQNASDKPLTLAGGSETLNPASADQIHFSHVVLKDDISGLSQDTRKVPCPSDLKQVVNIESSGNQENEPCSINDHQNNVIDDEPAMPTASSSLPDCIEEVTQESCENDNFSEVNQKKKKCLQLPCKGRRVENSVGKDTKPERRKVQRDATKTFLINKAPPILTIHLKRFSQDARGRLNKLSGHVSFQEILDLRPYMDPRFGEDKCLYRLVGVVEHRGTMRGGHYVAYVRAEKGTSKDKRGSGSAWFYASDAHVGEISLSEVLQSEAYILFFERV